jgi:polysaccharide pyruvyl transferase WcaK-like protein
MHRGSRASLVLDGYYGMRNAGDDAFCVVAHRHAREVWETEHLYFTGRQSELPVSGPDVHGLVPDNVRVKGEVRARIMVAMLRSGRVVHVGGSTFMSSMTRHRDQMRLARRNLISLDAVGVSVGPFADRETGERVAAALRQFRSVTLRDTASAERLSEVDSGIASDVAFDVGVLLAEDVDLPEPPNDRPVLGVSFCAHEALRGQDADVEAERFQRMVATVRRVATSSGCLIKLMVFNDHPIWGDVALTQQAAAELSDVSVVEIVKRTSDPRTLLSETASCTAVLATRLHHAVFAYSAGVPFAVVAYQAKGADFAAEVGLPDALVFAASGPAPAEAATVVEGLLSDPEPFRAQLPVSEAMVRARLAFPKDL